MVNYVSFPNVNTSNSEGLLAAGGDLSVDTLLSAYTQGIFPWFNDDQPILWWSPDPRLVLPPQEVKISRSLKKIIRQKQFRITINTVFEEVIQGCALRGASSKEQATQDTWITDSMNQAYVELHRQNYAHSIEVWQGEDLVGGLYGLALGSVFFGESMFSRKSNASKVALVGLCQHLINHHIKIIDCQVASDHLLSMGAKEIPREHFLQYLTQINSVAKTAQFDQLKHLQFDTGIENAINKV